MSKVIRTTQKRSATVHVAKKAAPAKKAARVTHALSASGHVRAAASKAVKQYRKALKDLESY